MFGKKTKVMIECQATAPGTIIRSPKKTDIVIFESVQTIIKILLIPLDESLGVEDNLLHLVLQLEELRHCKSARHIGNLRPNGSVLLNAIAATPLLRSIVQ